MSTRRLHPALVGFLTLAVAAALAVAVAPPASAEGVDRLAGRDRWTTAVRISQATFGPGVDTAWVASGTSFADALAAAPAAGRARQPVLLTRRGSVPDVVRAELRRLRPARIRIVGGTSAVSLAVEADLGAIAPVQRWDGPTRWATAAKISRLTFTGGARTAWIANGTTFPDALAAAPAATDAGGPLLLTERGNLPDATADELARLLPDRIVVLGGTGAVRTSVLQDLEQYADDVDRLAGPTRYDTAAMVADEFARSRSTVYVADGQDFPDALAIAPVAAAAGAPILLVRTRSLPAPTAAALDRLDPRDVVVVGGTGAVSNALALELAGYAAVPAWSPSSASVSAERLGSSWRSGCPVPPSTLRLVRLQHIGFDGIPRRGELIVHQRVVDEVQDAFRRLYQGRFPIRRMVTVEQYGADDDRSMDADNTSGFNCRNVAGTTSWSRHAYGLAIDINPVENPYLQGSRVSPPAGRAFVDRDDERPGMLLDGSGEVAAFTSRGFRWGGDFNSIKDWQHVDQAP